MPPLSPVKPRTRHIVKTSSYNRLVIVLKSIILQQLFHICFLVFIKTPGNVSWKATAREELINMTLDFGI